MPRRESIPHIVDRIAVEMARLEAQVARLRHMDELLEKTSREATGIKHSTRSRLGHQSVKKGAWQAGAPARAC